METRTVSHDALSLPLIKVNKRFFPIRRDINLTRLSCYFTTYFNQLLTSVPHNSIHADYRSGTLICGAFRQVECTIPTNQPLVYVSTILHCCHYCRQCRRRRSKRQKKRRFRCILRGRLQLPSCLPLVLHAAAFFDPAGYTAQEKEAACSRGGSEEGKCFRDRDTDAVVASTRFQACCLIVVAKNMA